MVPVPSLGNSNYDRGGAESGSVSLRLDSVDPSWVRERIKRQAAMVDIRDRMAFLDANLGELDGESSDKVFLPSPRGGKTGKTC